MTSIGAQIIESWFQTFIHEWHNIVSIKYSSDTLPWWPHELTAKNGNEKETINPTERSGYNFFIAVWYVSASNK